MRRLAIPLAALLALAVGLGAQKTAGFREAWDEAGRARLRFGPFSIVPSLSLQNVGYDDNVYFESRGRGDYTATIVPEARVYLPVGHSLLLIVRDAPEYDFYLREKNRRQFSNSYALGAQALLFDFFAARGGYEYEKHRRVLSPEIGSLVTDETRAVEAGLAVETSGRTSLAVSYFRRDVAVEDLGASGGTSLSVAFNRREKGLALEFRYPISSLSYFFLNTAFTEYAFAAADTAWRDSSAWALSGGLRFPLTGRISGLLALGYKKFSLKSGPFPGFAGLTADTELEARFGRFGVRVHYRRDNPFSFYQNVVYFIQDDYGGGVSFYLTAFLRLDYNYGYGLGDYPRFYTADPVTGLETAVRRRDRHQTHSVGLVMRIFADTGLGLTWSEIRWTSTLPGWDRQRRFIGATLSRRF
jgi:hypothetical protein